MKTMVDETFMGKVGRAVLASSTRTKLLAILEILAVYAVIQTLLIVWSSTGIVEWEKQHLGWSYTGASILVDIPALVIWLTRRNWVEYGVSSADCRTNLDIGLKGCLVRAIPAFAMKLGLNSNPLGANLLETMGWVIAVGVMVWILNRHRPVKSGRKNVFASLLLLSVPIVVSLAMSSLNVVIVSTMVWQFVLSGFGEEFVYRGYFQSRLNQAFGRPVRLFGIQFGAGLIIASFLFGLLHAFNSFDAAIGFSSLGWGWALSSFVAGLFFGVLREKTGTLVAPGIAHGLADAVGEPFRVIFGWM